MKTVKQVEFTICRQQVRPWLGAIARAIWNGDVRIKLHLDTENQTFVWIFDQPRRASKDDA